MSQRVTEYLVEHRALAARHKAKWRAVGKRRQIRRFWTANPPARQIENWHGVVLFPGNHGVFGFDPELWRAVVGPLSIWETRREFDH
jgi:hypothetical protein